MNHNSIVKAYLRLRDARAKAKKEFDAKDEELKGLQAQLEATLLKSLIDSGSESTRTDAGTFYRQEDLKPSAENWETFYEWVKEEDAFDFLEKRITKKRVQEYMEDHDNTPPPGVKVHREWVVRVRTNNK